MSGGSSATESPQQDNGRKYALVVGVNQSDKINNLSYLRSAEIDAHGLVWFLGQKACNFTFPAGVLVGEKASASSVRRAISQIIRGRNENDLLLFYFIGHGYPVEINGKFKVYLVTTDFDPKQAKDTPNAYLSLDEIREIFYENHRTASVISILDCCDAGYITEPPSPERQLAQLLDAFATTIRGIEQLPASSRRTWAILASAKATAYEVPNERGEVHPLMTGLILDAVNGAAEKALNRLGNLTLGTLYDYLDTKMQGLESINQHAVMQAMFGKSLILAHHPSEDRILRKREDYPQPLSEDYPQPLSLTLPFDMTVSQISFVTWNFPQVQKFLKGERVLVQQDYRDGPDEQAQMEALGLLQGEHFKYGALLCFGRNPSHQIVGAYTECFCWRGTSPNGDPADHEDCTGNLLEQFTQASSFLKKRLETGTDESSERPEIPFRVLQEALANALVHREYVSERDRVVQTKSVRVDIFSDHVQITNPGGLPPSLDIEHPGTYPRNPQIQRIFYLAKHVEKLGTGILRMNQWMQETGLPMPTIRPHGQMFTIILSRVPPPQAIVDTPAPESLPSFNGINTQPNGRKPIVANSISNNLVNCMDEVTEKRLAVYTEILRPRLSDTEGHDQDLRLLYPSQVNSRTDMFSSSMNTISYPILDQSDRKVAEDPDDNLTSQIQVPAAHLSTSRLPKSEPEEISKESFVLQDQQGMISTLTSQILGQTSQTQVQQQGYKRKYNVLHVSIRDAFIALLCLIIGGGATYFGGRLPSLTTHPTSPAPTTIEIASDFPTSGNDITSGMPLQNGVQIAINEANDEHLLPGYTLKLIPYNDVGSGKRHDPQVGANNLKQAIDDNLVAGVIGPYNSSVAFKELPIVNQAPLALLSPDASFSCLTKSITDDPTCTGTNDIAAQMRPTGKLTFFRLVTTTDRQGKANTDYFFQTKHYSKVLLLYDHSDFYSIGAAQAFQREWQNIGGLVISIDLSQNGSSMQDYQNKLQAASSSAPDFIYFAGGFTDSSSDILQALSSIATLKTVPFAGGGAIMKKEFLQNVAKLHRDAPVYISMASEDPAHSGTDTGTNFATNYANFITNDHQNYANAHQDYVPDAGSAYDCTMMLIQAIKAALQKGISTPHGTQDNAGAVQFRRAVLQALRQLSYTGATGTHSFDANGDTTNHTVSFYQADLSTLQPSWKWLQQVDVK